MVRDLKIVLAVLLLFSNLCYASNTDIITGMESYKDGKYEDCINKMKLVVKEDPTSVIGYYYLGLAYTKTGKDSLAVHNYNKVIALNSDSSLTKLSKLGKDNLNKKKQVVSKPEQKPAEEKQPTEDEEYNPILNDSAVNVKTPPKQTAEISEEKEQEPQEQQEKPEPKTTQVIKASDYAKASGQTQPEQPKSAVEYNPNREPTNDEIVNAIRILQKAGLLQNGAMGLTGGNTPVTPVDSRAQQMNSMLMMMNNGQNNNNMMQMMPYMNNGGKVDPQLMQMMLMQQMMPNFSGGGNNGNGY